MRAFPFRQSARRVTQISITDCVYFLIAKRVARITQFSITYSVYFIIIRVQGRFIQPSSTFTDCVFFLHRHSSAPNSQVGRPTTECALCSQCNKCYPTQYWTTTDCGSVCLAVHVGYIVAMPTVFDLDEINYGYWCCHLCTFLCVNDSVSSKSGLGTNSSRSFCFVLFSKYRK